MLSQAAPDQQGRPVSGAALVSPEMSALLAQHDWAATPLGPPETWPLELRTVVQIALSSRFPMVFWWGPSLIQIYNDAYIPIMGGKHPRALGQTAEQCWSEIWDVIGPQINGVLEGGPATWSEDVLLDINRHGFVGELYFTWSYSPLPSAEPGRAGGVMCAVQETTDKVIGERRILLLRDLAAHGTEARTVTQECTTAAATLGRYAKSVPFSLIYLKSADGTHARLAASSGIDPGDTHTAPPAIDLTGAASAVWPLAEAVRVHGLVEIDDLAERLEHVPAGPWPEPPRAAVIVPIQSSLASEPIGFLVAGVNPRESLDERYRSFYTLTAGQIAAAIASAGAYEDARARAEALAELDRVKIEFFSNVSHEFRTPLTLMLGPLAQLLRDADERSAPLLETAHRNALRLLKLVNTLLEFSRLEAGRSDAAFVATDLGTVTRDLCALFRSAVEAAGLGFAVEFEPMPPVFVDRTMWEMIVLNLLSNALKFTLEGSIGLRLRTVDDAAELSVSDTGTGIPEADLGHIFERFRRVRGSKSRSHEGSGIGLALVDELVRLHGGSIAVQSTVGRGTTFSIRIPFGNGHLEPQKIVADLPALPHASVVEQYLADIDATLLGAGTLIASGESGKQARVLVADDNSDLRAYITRILAPHHEVVGVANGREALDALRSGRFDLVVSDVMMPEMDGFELIAAIRNDPALAPIPFIMLSARAGESAAIEGLSRGADDYLVKPFSSEELLARVFAQLNAATIRERAMHDVRANEARFRTLAASMPHIVLEGDERNGVTFLSEAYQTYTGKPLESGLGLGWLDAIHRDDVAAAAERWTQALRSDDEFACEFRLLRKDGTYRWHLGRALAQHDPQDERVRWTGTITDIHDMRRSAQERAYLSEASRILAQSLDIETTLQNLAAFTTPLFADWCQIAVKSEDGSIRTVAIAHRDPEKHALAQLLVGSEHFNPQAPRATPYVMRTGRPDIVNADDAAGALAAAVSDPDALAIYRRLGVTSAACLPLSADGVTLGAIAVCFETSGRGFAGDDLPVLEEVARRAGVALQRATEFEREHRVAQSFQEASLPSTLPTVYGATFDAVYVPANDEAQVGGDWYDAVRLSDGRVVISIGDVAGNGLRAAVTMGNMRQIIRGIAQVHADPALMLDAADRALRLEHPDQFVTAFVGVYDPVGATFAFASAGHPPPMMRRPDGTVELLSSGGLPLGLRQLSRDSGHAIAIAPGSFLVFYTDGLTEATRRPAEGEERLLDLLARGTTLLASHPAQAIRDAVFHGSPATDDVAILVMGIGDTRDDAGTPIERHVFDAADAVAGQSARRAFTARLRERTSDRTCIANAEVVFGELVSNAARYAPGPIEVAVDWSAPAPVLHVLDRGPGVRHVPALPRDVYSETGRGLYLISALSDDFSVAKRIDGGSHARAVIACAQRAEQ